jgi:hypothetical protein
MSNLSLNQNQFNQTAVIGQVAFQPNVDTETCQINPSTSAAVIVAGCAVKLVSVTGPQLIVDATTSASDGPVYGVIAYNMRKNSYVGGDQVEVACDGNVVFLKSSAAITRGTRVSVTNPTISTNDPTVATDTTALDYTLGVAVGYATAAGQIVRVKISTGLNNSTGTVSVSP